MHVVFLINSLEGGGAERVYSLLAEALMETPHQVTFVTLDQRPAKYQLPDGADLVCLNSNTGFVDSLTKYWRFLRKKTPDMVVSFLTRANFLNVVCRSFFGYQCVISERSNTVGRIRKGLNGSILWNSIRATYPRADQVIAVSEGVASCLKTQVGIAASKIKVIHNPYPIERIRSLSQQAFTRPFAASYIIAAGRLIPSKRFDDLLYAYAHSQSALKLVILGEGPERDRLESLSQQLGIAQDVRFVGFAENPFPYFTHAEMFVLTSELEGFPNALVEAMVCGCPVIASHCQDGPAEILDKNANLTFDGLWRGRYGILFNVGDTARLSEAIVSLSNSPSLLDQYSTLARQRAQEFDIDRISRQYIATLFRTSASPTLNLCECQSPQEE